MPLIRQGEGPEGLERVLGEEIERAKRVAKIIDEANDEEPESKAPKQYGLGDTKQYRGLPVFPPHGGIPGAMQGSRPGDSAARADECATLIRPSARRGGRTPRKREGRTKE